MSQSKLSNARHYCEINGHRFTLPREGVLRVLLQAQKPLGAYDILQQLSAYLPDPKPQTVYRAVSFWQIHGFIHSIDSLKSYIACCHQQHIGQVRFLICSGCEFVKELSSAIDLSPISAEAKSIHFAIASSVIEIKGLCVSCDQSSE